MYKSLSDRELVSLYISGNEQVLETIIKKHQSRIYNFILKHTKNRYLADDIFQDVFIKMIKLLKSNKYNEEGKFSSWLIRVTYNIIIDTFRMQKRKKTVDIENKTEILDFLYSKNINTENEIIEKQTLQKLNILIDSLPKKQKEVFKMRIFNDLSFKEISEEMDSSINTALGRMRYAVNKLKKEIKDYNIKFYP